MNPPSLLTLHEVILPAVGELAVAAVEIQPAKVHVVRVAVLKVDQVAQALVKLSVARGTVHIRQDGCLILSLTK